MILLLSFCTTMTLGQDVSEIANKKNTETINMVKFYINSEFDKLEKLFPNYKSHKIILQTIKTYSKSKFWEMKPNYLRSLQGDSTQIVLSVANPKDQVIAYLVSFTSTKPDSKIASIKRSPKFDLKSEKEDQIIKPKKNN
jgi:hypothetical protein